MAASATRASCAARDSRDWIVRRLEEAKRNWRLIPATRDGVPIAQWYKVRVTFKLTNQ